MVDRSLGLGEISLQRKNYTQAEEYLRHAVKAAPDYGPAHYYLGLDARSAWEKSGSG